MPSLFDSSKMSNTKYLTLLLILFISFYNTFAVHTCYTCSNADDCKTLNKTDDCKTDKNDTQHYLCTSTENKSGGAVSRGCMKNDAEDIRKCDEQHLTDDKFICYHCDREKCNSASVSSASVVFASVIAYIIVKFIY